MDSFKPIMSLLTFVTLTGFAGVARSAPLENEINAANATSATLYYKCGYRTTRAAYINTTIVNSDGVSSKDYMPTAKYSLSGDTECKQQTAILSKLKKNITGNTEISVCRTEEGKEFHIDLYVATVLPSLISVETDPTVYKDFASCLEEMKTRNGG